MGLFLDSFWRAVAYCLHPRVIALSFLPLLLMIAIGWALSYFFWDGAVATARGFLEGLTWLGPVWTWLVALSLSIRSTFPRTRTPRLSWTRSLPCCASAWTPTAS